jgi:hypothetical protein
VSRSGVESSIPVGPLDGVARSIRLP